MPDKGESVVEDVGRVGPRVAGIKHIGSIGFCQLHLHKLGKIFIYFASDVGQGSELRLVLN